MKAKKKAERAWEPYYCDMRKSWVLPLTQGLEALIDEQDVPLLEKYKWYANTVNTSSGKKSYTYPCSYPYGRADGYVYLHRFIMLPKKGEVIDHLNGNTLDNRRSNMRVCSYRENNCNKSTHRDGRLVGANKTKRGTYVAQIRIDGNLKYLGTFKTEHEAHQSYLAAYNELITKEKSAA